MSNIGYIRVSTVEQNTVRQLDGIELDKVFVEHASGSTKNREQLTAMLEYMRDGDIVHVHSIDRLARNLSDLKELVNAMIGKGVTVQFHKEAMKFNSDKSDSMSNLMFNILGSFAEFERELMLERQREGIAKAKEQGKYKGRTKSVDADAIRNAMKKEGASFRKVAKELGVSLSTVQRAMKAGV
ncbi:recombinase family protein [Acinetobacter lwoffii]|uniref:recombinase family protein n=1 Tax=Acinetobacter lwoffii TaxID=28090 RepID=UPI00209B43CA|nr:recombinase family protein [Acinetobacter lwoffii]MCO8080804.1 recombinase family protein [Acinetobacter lwoffii]